MFRHIPLLEKILVFLLLVVIVVFSWQLFLKFREEYSIAVPAMGGVYTEGLSGKLTTLNPLLARSSVDRDIAHLIFSGLTRYNPSTGEIEGDLATYSLSNDKRVYTFRLKDNIYWHDGQPVTADDVVYTYKVVLQNPYFKNSFLRGAFKDVEIEKISDREVLFTLKKPYSFFLSNVTVGLLPKHMLNLVPVENLEKSDFNQHPIGSGPFEFVSIEHGPYESRVVLRRHDKYHTEGPFIDSVVFRIFPTDEDLISNANSLTAVRNYSGFGGAVLDKRFRTIDYTLPQYVAAFLNTQSPIFAVGKTRFGFLLATDKEALVAELGGKKEIVDTPLLETKQGLDIEYNELRAKGAFFDTDWKLIKKDATTHKHSYNVEILATHDTWVELSVDGDKREGFLMQPNDKKRFTFRDVFTFVNIGNAGGIVFSVDGVEGKKIGLEGEVLKNFVVSAESLQELLIGELPAESVATSDGGNDDAPSAEPENTYSFPEDAVSVFVSNIDSSELRYNKEGEPLRVRLITASTPKEFIDVAKILQKQWVRAGVDVIVEIYDPDVLQSKIRERNYDVLLFGENLGYNLDAFPFWHSSQVEGGLNLSQYKSLEADTLLTEIRSLFDVSKKTEKLNQLKKQIIKDTPAIFLYRPVYQYAVDKKVRGMDLVHLAIDSNRFNGIQSWFLREKMAFRENVSFGDFLSWLYVNSKL